jgi:CheY-like chemotaxis protein
MPKSDIVKILIVEDNEASADMLSRRLGRRGFVAVIARDGLEGVEAAGREKPDVILMDLGLPELDGWEATRRIKRNPDTAGIPVVALTANALVSDRERAFAAGCIDYETKPVDFDRLVAKIQAVLVEGVGHA